MRHCHHFVSFLSCSSVIGNFLFSVVTFDLYVLLHVHVWCVCYLYLFACIDVQHIYALGFFSSSCVPFVSGFCGLSVLGLCFFFFILCALCFRVLWIVRSWFVVLFCFSSSCVSFVSGFCALSVLGLCFSFVSFVLCAFSYRFLCIVRSWLPFPCSLTFIYKHNSD